MSTLLSTIARVSMPRISSPAPAAVEGIAMVVGTIATARTKIIILTLARMALRRPR